MRRFDKYKHIEKANLLVEQRYVDSKENKADKVTLDVPLLIRLMEFSKEDASEDVDLHIVAENLIKLSERGKSLSMEDYEAAVDGAKTKVVSKD